VRKALAVWWLVACAGASIGLQFRPHYFLQTLPALCALAGIGAAGLAERIGQPGGAPARLATAALAALIALLPVLLHRDLLLAESPAAVSRRIYGLNPFPEAAVFADEIRRMSLPGDRVFVVGSEPQILFLSGRRSASRYIFFYPLTGDYPDARARQQQAIDEVRAAQPLYIVWVDVVTSLLRTPRSQPLIFDAMLEMVARDYQLEMIAHVDVSTASYRTLRGEQARRWASEAAQREALPLVALYRRVRS
jgi:hypothetical protein